MVVQGFMQRATSRFERKDFASDVRGVKARRLTYVAALVGLIAFVPGSSARMQSVEIAPKVCQTTGGGKFVDIPGFPGERIDRRLLKDIKVLRRKYKIFVTDGFSTSSVHSANGEHPRGLALDIVPNFSAGGDWNDIDRLANWAEPRQNQPRSPFRWVGYNGDSGHGRGHHLHLSYSHSGAPFGKPAKTIYSIRCPEPRGDAGRDNDGKGGGGNGGRGDGDGAKNNNDGGGSGGGITADGGGKGGNGGGDKDGGGGKGGGGISPRSSERANLAPIHPETGGVDG